MKMSNKAYDILKIVALLVIPSIGACTGAILKAWNCPYTEPIMITINAITACIGGIVTKLSYDYNKSKSKEVK